MCALVVLHVSAYLNATTSHDVSHNSILQPTLLVSE